MLPLRNILHSFRSLNHPSGYPLSRWNHRSYLFSTFVMVCILDLSILIAFSISTLWALPNPGEPTVRPSVVPPRAPQNNLTSPPASSPKLAPPPPKPASSSSTCKSVRVRKEWRTLSYEQQADYIKSIKCLVRLPSKLLGPSYRRWDDFEYVHCDLRKRLHTRPLFLPWHRYFTFVHEKILREECGFRGTVPYWNWTLDHKNITHSPVWSSDPVVGFGSNGSFFGPGSDPDDLDAGVVTDGAFARFPIYYPGRMMLQRNFHLDPPFAIPGYYLGSQWYNPNNMEIIASQANFSTFTMKLEGNYKQPDGTILPGPHSIIHSLLGGDMPDLAYSVNDVSGLCMYSHPVILSHANQHSRIFSRCSFPITPG
ncbi:uncharacterized protein PGTG_21816 [Puccinia graminis f. sp. tritici CRL 75-36-700-3]|uniref:Tyrosinase copper-binding domain-containing protein n=1 Tax=Puccinia graminis f. sp. tritici (strain CRL 75-36-700-3 / race SCCL) TaxID=418459 RepID=H6QSQ9_PUCGT|nr:uncharacterized protein PGTG_21816 [Puccinia graminis f. sp. tritici CRL 75-36-700-3]EHS63799.1 hypothetical protein PGTG_21816 [Puccinia graminis f. sp. tritici CRL 75-36-700-3]